MELYIMMFLVASLFSLAGLFLPFLNSSSDDKAEKDGISNAVLGLGALMFIVSGIIATTILSWGWIIIFIGIIILLIIGIKLIGALRW